MGNKDPVDEQKDKRDQEGQPSVSNRTGSQKTHQQNHDRKHKRNAHDLPIPEGCAGERVHRQQEQAQHTERIGEAIHREVSNRRLQARPKERKPRTESSEISEQNIQPHAPGIARVFTTEQPDEAVHEPGNTQSNHGKKGDKPEIAHTIKGPRQVSDGGRDGPPSFAAACGWTPHVPCYERYFRKP